jgi:hypothetical protein
LQEGFFSVGNKNERLVYDMARMTCTCGMELSNHEVPNDIELVVYTDKEWDKICDCDTLEPWMIPRPKYKVWRCPMFSFAYT